MNARSLAIITLAALSLTACSEPPQPTVSLYRALHSGDLDQVKRHLYWKTDIDKPDANGDFPLHVLARTNRVSIARELLASGADPRAVNAAGDTPLYVALYHGKTLFAKLLLDHHAPLDPQAMFIALITAGVSDRDVYDLLIQRGARVDLADTAGNTPLHIAIAQGHLDAVSRLLANGAPVNQPNGAGRMPLDLARTQGIGPDAKNIERLLLNNGARSGSDADATPSPTTHGDP